MLVWDGSSHGHGIAILHGEAFINISSHIHHAAFVNKTIELYMQVMVISMVEVAGSDFLCACVNTAQTLRHHTFSHSYLGSFLFNQ